MVLITNIKKKVLGNEFTKNVLTLMTGTTIAQFIPIAMSPILTRMYSPKDFGVLALFNSIVFIFGPIANGKYEQAIILPDKDEDAINITVLSILTAFFLSLLMLIVAILFNSQLTHLLGNEDIAIWLYFAPVVIFLTGVFTALSQFNIRRKKFGNIAKATVSRSVSLAAVQLVLGAIKAGSAGLISGQIIASFSGNSTLGIKLLKEKELIKTVNKDCIKAMAKRHIDFPKYYMWAILANSLSYNIISFFMSSVFSAATLGFYSLGNKILGMPTSLIGNSIGQVFFKEAVEEKNKTGKSIKTFKGTLKRLLFIAIPFFAMMFFIVEDLFAIVFGEEWRQAGTFARIMLPVFFVRFMLSPLTYTYNVYEKQKVALIWQTTLLALTIITFIMAQFLGLSIMGFLYLFSLLITLHYLLLFIILYKLSNGKEDKITV